jgi:hypothetical protein
MRLFDVLGARPLIGRTFLESGQPPAGARGTEAVGESNPASRLRRP